MNYQEFIKVLRKEMVLISTLEKMGFVGVDATLSISLFEYGIAWIRVNDDEYVFSYGVEYDDDKGIYETFASCMLKKSEFDSTFDWVGAEIYEYNDKYDDLDFPDKIDTIRRYYGDLNVFGTPSSQAMIFDSEPVKGEAFPSSKRDEEGRVYFEYPEVSSTFTLIGYDDELSEGVTAEIFAVIRGDFAYFWSEVE